MFYCGPMKIEKLKKCNVSNAGIAHNMVKRKTVCSEPRYVLRGEKCPDASRMFALKYRVRRDLNTDVSVLD